MKIPIWLIAALLSILSASTGQILLKMGVAAALPSHSFKNLGEALGALANPFVMAGIAAFGVSMILWLGAIKGQQLSSVYPLAALGYVIVAAASVFIFRDTMSVAKVLGIALIVLGTVVLSMGGTAASVSTAD